MCEVVGKSHGVYTGQRTIFRNWFDCGIEFRSSSLAASAFTCWIIFPHWPQSDFYCKIRLNKLLLWYFQVINPHVIIIDILLVKNGLLGCQIFCIYFPVFKCLLGSFGLLFQVFKNIYQLNFVVWKNSFKKIVDFTMIKNQLNRVEEITQGLKALVALPKNPGSITSIHMAIHNCL